MPTQLSSDHSLKHSLDEQAVADLAAEYITPVTLRPNSLEEDKSQQSVGSVHSR